MKGPRKEEDGFMWRVQSWASIIKKVINQLTMSVPQPTFISDQSTMSNPGPHFERSNDTGSRPFFLKGSFIIYCPILIFQSITRHYQLKKGNDQMTILCDCDKKLIPFLLRLGVTDKNRQCNQIFFTKRQVTKSKLLDLKARSCFSSESAIIHMLHRHLYICSGK